MSNKRCVFCKQTIIGFGNNAEPVKHGKCCDYCDAAIVIPTRIEVVLSSRQENKRGKEIKAYGK